MSGVVLVLVSTLGKRRCRASCGPELRMRLEEVRGGRPLGTSIGLTSRAEGSSRCMLTPHRRSTSHERQPRPGVPSQCRFRARKIYILKSSPSIEDERCLVHHLRCDFFFLSRIFSRSNGCGQSGSRSHSSPFQPSPPSDGDGGSPDPYQGGE